METFFMNTENSKTDESNKFRYYFTDKINLKDCNKNIVLVNLSIYYTWKNSKSAYNNECTVTLLIIITNKQKSFVYICS